MSRPRKSRSVCHFPGNLSFSPGGFAGEKKPVVLSVDEYETIRLIDLEGFSQESCGEWMGIARTTVQMIYASARKKLAQMLVEGRPLRIEGGDYRLCDGGKDCGQTHCYKQYFSKQYEKQHSVTRIAVICEEGKISRDFAQAGKIKLYDIREGRILTSRIVELSGDTSMQLPGVLTALQTDILLCDHIGAGDRLALEAGMIRPLAGVSGDADSAVAEILSCSA